MEKEFKGFILNAYLIIMVMAFMLTGCSSSKPSDLEVKHSLTTCTEEAGILYSAGYFDTEIAPDYTPSTDSITVTDNWLYFADNMSVPGQKIYRRSVTESEGIEALPIDLGNCAVWCLATNRAETEIYCYGNNAFGNGFLAGFQMDGKQLWFQEFDEELQQLILKNPIGELICDNQGRFYCLSDGMIYLFNETGENTGRIVCPEERFVDICVCGEDEVYTSYESESKKYISISKVDYVGKKMSEGKDVLGNGMLYPGRDDTMLICDGESMYYCNPDSEKIVQLFRLTDYDISSTRIQNARLGQSGEILLVDRDILNTAKPIGLTRMVETTETEINKDERQVITFLGLVSDEYWSDVISEYNKQSRDYRVVYEAVPLEGTLYARLNARLQAKESADIIWLFNYTDMENYLDKGYLEDLTPYMEKSECLKPTDFVEEVLDCLKKDGKVYGVSTLFSIETLMGRSDEVGDTTGWTVNEFLRWLEENPGTAGEEGNSKERILEYCLIGNLEAYVGNKSNETEKQESLKNLLQRINQIEADETEYWSEWDTVLQRGTPILQRMSMASFHSVTVSTENAYGGQLVYKGYPTANGEPKHLFRMNTLCILSRSTCKEGAFDFLEYVMEHENDLKSRYSPLKDEYNENLEQAYEESTWIIDGSDGEPENWLFTEEMLEKQLDLLPDTVCDSYDAYTIRIMIIEEAQAYFEGAKGLDETCHIIQNRVQLYIDENELY